MGSGSSPLLRNSRNARGGKGVDIRVWGVSVCGLHGPDCIARADVVFPWRGMRD